VCASPRLRRAERSGFHYQYSNYQIEYSRNLVFEVGGHMEQVVSGLIDRSRAPLDLKTIKTTSDTSIVRKIAGEQALGRMGSRGERPTYDLTIFFQAALRQADSEDLYQANASFASKVVAHNTRELTAAGRSTSS